MLHRLAVGALWFLAIVALGNVLALLFGFPRAIGPIAAFVVTALIVADPGNLLWEAPGSERRMATRGPDRASVAVARAAPE